MRTTTDPDNWHFSFTISDLGRFLGKSPVTIRAWERTGFVTIPREGLDRRVDCASVREIANTARQGKRILQPRLDLINAALTLLEMVEKENSK